MSKLLNFLSCIMEMHINMNRFYGKKNAIENERTEISNIRSITVDILFTILLLVSLVKLVVEILL